MTQALPEHGLYRRHLPDPVSFEERLSVTLQQIGTWDLGLFEGADDISTVSYWCQTGVRAESGSGGGPIGRIPPTPFPGPSGRIGR